MALLKITEAGGREWEHSLSPNSACTIGRAAGNTCVLDDSQASRHHAHIIHRDGGFVLVDGSVVGGQVKRSTNHVYVNGEPRLEHRLEDGDRITIGASTLQFEMAAAAPPPAVDYDDDPLGHTQLLVSTGDVIRAALEAESAGGSAPEELAALRRKGEILSLLYEMSTALSSVFTLDVIFEKAADILLRVTPADRVLVLLVEPGATPAGGEPQFKVAKMRVRDPAVEAKATQTTIGRTITRKVMRERAALLSQDAAADPELGAVESILSQGIRSTICAPLIADSTVHGALYADRLDPLAWFTRDDLQLVTAVASQTAVAVESARSHERLAREEVARATYGRFLPDYVVKQILEDPAAIKLGGVSQTITVLFADIRGFTRLSEHASPEKVVLLLNRYFSVMSEIIFTRGGTLDKFIGDGLMALFGAPYTSPHDASDAITAAIEMQRAVKQIEIELRASGLGEISIGIGLHTGEATVGYIGSDRRSEYTAIGDTVNVSSRLESHAKAGEILVSEETMKAAGEMTCLFVPRDPIRVKNRQRPVRIFEIDWTLMKT
jgi:adenylate cyclase